MYPSVTHGDVLKTVVLFAVQKCHFQITPQATDYNRSGGSIVAFSLSCFTRPYDAIPSSEQIMYNSGEISGGKRQHLAYVTNVNASESQLFFWFYSLALLI